jgi:tetratricopeptide (TPR) repeat protein
MAEVAIMNDPGNLSNLEELGVVFRQLCHCLAQLDRQSDAISAYRRLVAIQKSLHLRQVVNPAADEVYLREIVKTVLIMMPLLTAQRITAPTNFLREALVEMRLVDVSEGNFGLCAILAEGDLAALMRRTGRPDEAKRLVAKMLKYAKSLAERFPRDPLAYLALSEAQIHVVKNAYRYHDSDPETGLRQALESAKRALAISPGNAKAEAAVADRRRRLANYLSGS